MGAAIMNKFCLIVLFAVAAPAAYAQSEQPEQSVTIPGYHIAMPERTISKLMSNFETYRGAYDLSNGQTLSLMAIGARMYAKLDDGEHHELAATGNGRYVAKDLTLKITLVKNDDGDFGGELLIAKSPVVAGQPVEYVHLVAAR